MKTLAELKRTLRVGDSLTLVEAPLMPNHRYIGIKRYVTKVQTNGICLGMYKEQKTGTSFLGFPNAKLTEFDGKEIRTYYAGERELTEEEKKVYENRPSSREENKEQVRRDILSGSNVMYWLDKQYFQSHNMGYLHYEEHPRYRFLPATMTIKDEQIKGNLGLRYVLEKED